MCRRSLLAVAPPHCLFIAPTQKSSFHSEQTFRRVSALESIERGVAHFSGTKMSDEDLQRHRIRRWITSPPTADDSARTTGATPAEQGVWSAIRESLRGTHRAYTEGPIGRSIILLAIPMVLEMCMESIFAVVDIKWVSYLGPDAMATVGLTESLLTLMYAIAIGLSIGATATVARRIGEHNPDGAARAAIQAHRMG